MSKLVRLRGDPLRPIAVSGHRLVPHVTNNLGGWGAGFSCEVSKISHLPERDYRRGFAEGIVRLGTVQFVPIHNDITVANMVAQEGINHYQHMVQRRPQLRYTALVQCMRDVLDHCHRHDFPTIHSPKFGSCLAGGHWPTIENLILEIWVDRGIDVFVYDYEPNTQHWNIIDTFEVPTLPN